jgi:hypothetical protein
VVFQKIFLGNQVSVPRQHPRQKMAPIDSILYTKRIPTTLPVLTTTTIPVVLLPHPLYQLLFALQLCLFGVFGF